MKLRAQKGNGGHITSYNVILGSREVREAGFLNEDGTPKPVNVPAGTIRSRISRGGWHVEHERQRNTVATMCSCTRPLRIAKDLIDAVLGNCCKAKNSPKFYLFSKKSIDISSDLWYT